MTTYMPDDERRKRRRREAADAERFAAEYLGGFVDNKRADHDVRDRWGRPYEVKNPSVGFTFVNGGDRRHRPIHPAIVVELLTLGFIVVGTVRPRQWVWGAPRPGFAECWYVLRAEIEPDAIAWPAPTSRGTELERGEVDRVDNESATRLALGVDSPPEVDPVERRRAEWRKYQRRHRAREKAAEGLGLLYPDDPPRGLGDNPGSGKRPVDPEREESDDDETPTDPDHRGGSGEGDE